MFIAVAYLIRSIDFKTLNWKKILTDYRLVSVISLLIFGYGLTVYNVFFYVLAVFILAIFYGSNRLIIPIVLAAEGLIAFYFFEFSDLAYFTICFSGFLVAESAFQKKISWAHIVLLLTGGVMSFLIDHSMLSSILNFGFIIVVIAVAHFRWFLGLGFALGVLIITMDFSFAKFFPLLITVLVSANVYVKKIDVARFIAIGGIVLFSAFNYQYFQKVSPDQQPVAMIKAQTVKPAVKAKGFMQEGRTLEIAENTLVMPHTQAETVAVGISTLGEYMRLMVFPYELSFYYGYAKTKTVGFDDPLVWISLIVHLGLIFLAVWQIKKRPLLSIGVMWYLLSILLFSNWVELVAGMVGERLAFTASAGFCIFIASVILWIRPDLSFKKPGAVGLTIVVVLLVLTGRTIMRNADWKNPLTLMSGDMNHLQSSAQANRLYAINLMAAAEAEDEQTQQERNEKRVKAVSHFVKALQIWPDFYNAAIDGGRAAMTIGDKESAIQCYEKAIKISPTNLTEPYYALIELYGTKGQNKIVLEKAKAAFKIEKTARSYDYMLATYAINGYADSAKQMLSEGLKNHPEDMKLNYRQCDLYIEEQRYAEYLIQARKLFNLNSKLDFQNQNYQAYNYLARGYAINGKADSARIVLENGLRQYPGNTDLTHNLEVMKGKNR